MCGAAGGQRVEGTQWATGVQDSSQKCLAGLAGNSAASHVYDFGLQWPPGAVTVHYPGCTLGCMWAAVPLGSVDAGFSRLGARVRAVSSTVVLDKPLTARRAGKYRVVNPAQGTQGLGHLGDGRAGGG